MKDTCDIEMINTTLQNLKYDFIVKPDANGTEFTWLCASDNSYTLKVPTSFMLKFEEELKNMNDLEDGDLDEIIKEKLQGLFGFTFRLSIKDNPSFWFDQKLGFCSEDYAEYSIEYEPIELMELTDAEFTVGDMNVRVSPCSSLFYLLIKQFDREDVENIYHDDNLYDIIKLQKLGNTDNIRKVHSYTIKLKGISSNVSLSFEFFESLQDDLYNALYYLSVLFPTPYDELPKIANLLSEIDFDEEPWVSLNRDMNISLRKVAKPSHPIALRFFYHADLLVSQGVGQEATLYYYKVLEHFFTVAWRSQKIGTPRPPNEKASLHLVLEFEPHHPIWQTVTENKFCNSTVDALTEKVYKTRCELAHGKAEQEIIVPHLFNHPEELSETLVVFRAIAKAALLKFGGVTL